MPELANREEFEIQLAGKLGKHFGSKRRELQQLLGDPPNTDNVSFTFWDELQELIEEEIMIMALLVLAATASGHGVNLGSIVMGVIAVEMARQDSQAFVSRARENLTVQGDRWRTRQQQGLPITRQDIADRTLRILGPRAAENLSVTGVSHAQTNGADRIVRMLRIEGRVIVSVWRHTGSRPAGHSRAAERPCPICSPREGKDEPDWRGLKPGFAHPHCDCFVEILEIGPDGKRRKINKG